MTRRLFHGYYLILIILILLNCQAKGQVVNNPYAETASSLLNSIANSENEIDKFNLSDSLRIMLEEFISNRNNFSVSLNDVRYLGQLFSYDSLVRVFSWNIPLGNGSNRYSCIISRRNSDDVQSCYLEASSGVSLLGQDDTIKYDNWYGSLYYDIREFVSASDTLYLVLGFDLNGLYTNGKVIDVLGFDSKGLPFFGAPLIRLQDGLVSRMVFRYSSMAAMMLRSESDTGRIVFDHLSPSEPSFTGVYQYYGPDSSYDALEFHDGLWVLVPDVDLRNRQ